MQQLRPTIDPPFSSILNVSDEEIEPAPNPYNQKPQPSSVAVLAGNKLLDTFEL
jgi:hypothetical protein